MRSATFNQQSFRLIFVAYSLSLIGCGPPSDRILEETVEQSYNIEPTTRISIVSVQPGTVAIETTFPREPTWGLRDRSGTVDYTIVVPDTANISRLELANGEISVKEMRGQSVQARLETGQLFMQNCFSNVDVAIGRGTLTLAYEWWEPGKFSVQTKIADGNAWAFLPSDAAFHLIAETVRGKIASDFTTVGEHRAEAMTKVDVLVNGGGETEIRMRAPEGNIKVVEQNP